MSENELKETLPKPHQEEAVPATRRKFPGWLAVLVLIVLIAVGILGGYGSGMGKRYSAQDTFGNYRAIKFKSIPEDSALRAQVESSERYNLTLGPTSPEAVTSLASLHFFPPVKGVISGHFDIRSKHFGTDIVSRLKSPVSAVLDGTVIFTGWTMETGFVIEVQHQNNIVSVYKHNESLLKETGDRVRAGEPISIIGSTGELYTSGPHLHFEIWYKGSPLDPEEHILF